MHATAEAAKVASCAIAVWAEQAKLRVWRGILALACSFTLVRRSWLTEHAGHAVEAAAAVAAERGLTIPLVAYRY